MTFVIAVGVQEGPLVLTCASIEELLNRMRTQLGEPEQVLHEVGLWALHVKSGDWLDWDRGWVFAVSATEPLYVRDERSRKVSH